MATPRIWESVREHARRSPHAEALRWTGGALTYGALVASAREVAREAAPGPGGVGIVRADRAGAAVIAVLAAQEAGLPALVIPQEAGAGYVEALHRDLGPNTGQDPYRGFRRRPPEAPAPSASEASPERGGLWTTTSGSTGAPKIVAHDPHGIDRFTDWARTRFSLTPDDASLSLSPVNFDIATLDVWAVLRAGGRVVFAARQDLTDGRALAAAIDSHRVTLVQGVPVVLTLLAGAAATSRWPRTVVSTGDFFPPDAVPGLAAAFPRAELLSVYGSTETNDSFVLDLRTAAPGELGTPIEGVSHRVEPVASGAAGSFGAAAPDGAGRTGELVVSTPFQALGYANAPNDAWRTTGGTREFRTGDLVTVDPDGTLRLIGRADRQVKVRGVRVSLDDVEAVLRRQDGVADAVVAAVPTAANDREVVAAVRLRSVGASSNLALRAAAARALHRAAVPSRILLTTDPFPVTGTGKTDREGTIARHIERRPA